jgi:hypothetical protein
MQMTPSKVVLLRKQRLDDAVLTDHVKRLTGELSLDAYQTRLSLLGDGLSILRLLDSKKVDLAGRILTEMDYRWAIVDPRRSRVRPFRANKFQAGKNGVIFEGPTGTREIKKGSAILAVLGGMRGDVLGKVMRKAAFSSKKDVAIAFGEKYQTIISARPILDLYVLPPAGESAEQEPEPIRLMPGKFNPESLGDRATNSANRNIDQALRLVKEYGKPFFLEMDFGLFGLPNCRFDTRGDEDALQANLKALTQYGWYLVRLYEQERARESKQPQQDVLATITEAIGEQTEQALAAVAPALAAAAMVMAEGEKVEKPDELPDSSDSFLPAPPDLFLHRRIRRFSIGNSSVVIHASGAFVILVVAVIAGTISPNIGNFLSYWGLQKGLALFFGAGYFFFLSFAMLRLKRWMENTPTSKARSAAMGMVEMKGNCQRIYNLVSPISQTPCVYFRLRRYQKEKNSKGQEYWGLKQDYDSGNVPFFLYDETGKVLVDPTGADVRPGRKATYTGDVRTPWGSLFPIASDEKCVEETIGEGAPCYVLGFASPRLQPQKPLRQRVAERMRDLKANRSELMQYDTNDDGMVDEVEWDAARADIERKVTEQALAEGSKAKKSEEQVVIQKPKVRGLPFVVSEASEGKLTRGYVWKMGFSFAAALVCTAIGIVLLVS